MSLIYKVASISRPDWALIYEKQKSFDNEAEPTIIVFVLLLLPPIPFDPILSSSFFFLIVHEKSAKTMGSLVHKNRYFRRRNDCTRLNDRPGKGNFIFSRSAPFLFLFSFVFRYPATLFRGFVPSPSSFIPRLLIYSGK